MGDILGLTVDELVTALGRRQQRLPFEIGAFVALEACEVLIQQPAAVRPNEVQLTPDGNVSIFAPHSASNEQACRASVKLLARLLVAAGSGVPPNLLRLVERGPSSGEWDLHGLRDELEAALVPLNRSAARRVLARLIRDVSKPQSGNPVRSPNAAVLDADLDALLGTEEEEDPAEMLPTQRLGALDAAGVPITLPESVRDFVPQVSAQPMRKPAVPKSTSVAAYTEEPFDASSSAEATAPLPSELPSQLPSQLPSADRPHDVDFDDFEGKSSSTAWAWVAGLSLLIGAAALAVALLRPDILARMRGETVELTSDVPDVPIEAKAARFGELTVSVSPARAQVLLFVGRGPATTASLNLGAAYEFVAIADSGQTTRAVVPATAQFTDSHYDLAMQVPTEVVAEPLDFSKVDVGATLLERDAMGQPNGNTGQIRIITNPPNARVYMVVGFAPDVRISDLPIDTPVELLVAHEGHALSRATVGPSDWKDADGTPRADLSISLEKL